MAKRQKLDYSVRQAIVKLDKEKHTIREISEKVKRSKIMIDGNSSKKGSNKVIFKQFFF